MIRAFIVSGESARVDSRERLWLKERLASGNVLGGKPEDWVRFLSGLPADEKTLWRELILQQVKYFTVGIDEISSFDDERLLDVSKQIIPAIVTLGQPERARLEQGVTPSYPLSLRNVEFVPAHELRTSESGRTSSMLFRRGSPRQLTWDTLLHPVLSIASSLVVVDKFLFESFSRNPGADQTRFQESGVHWLLAQIRELHRSSNLPLQIYTSFDDLMPVDVVEEICVDLLTMFPETPITLAVCRRSIFRKLIHRRYIRIIANGRSRAFIQIDPGIDGLDASHNGLLMRDIDFLNRTSSASSESDETIASCRVDEERVKRAALNGGVVIRTDEIFM